jgi:hypothetical protein
VLKLSLPKRSSSGINKGSRTGAPIVKVIHHGSRVSNSTHSANNIKKEEMNQVTKPGPAVFGAHLDQSSWQGFNVIHKHFPDECETLLHGRCMIVNVGFSIVDIVFCLFLTRPANVFSFYQAWRPIKTVYKHPFGMADATTVPPEDLVIRANRWLTDI